MHKSRSSRRRRCKRLMVTAVVLGVLTCLTGCAAAEQTNRPQTQPTPVTAPAEPTSQRASAFTMRLLEDLEAAGEKHKTIRANIIYKVENPTLGDSEQREGWVAFSRSSKTKPAKFRVHFDTLSHPPGPKKRARIDWAFDGTWLTHAVHKTRQMTRYQIAAKGQKVEPLRIGKGPFPMPLGQKRNDILEHFEAAGRDAAKGEPTGTVYLNLTTRPRFRKQLSFVKLGMWVDAATHLPVRIISHDRSKNITTVNFKDVRSNEKLEDALFEMPRPLGWTVTVKPLDK